MLENAAGPLMVVQIFTLISFGYNVYLRICYLISILYHLFFSVSESLSKFPRRPSVSSGLQGQAQQPDEQQQQQQQQTMTQNSNNEQSSVQATAMQLPASNGVGSVNNSLNAASTSTSGSTIAGLLHQNSMNSRQQNSINNASSPYGGNSVQMPSPGSSSTIPQAQSNPSFQTPTPPSSNNPSQTSHSGLAAANHIGSTNSPANMSMQQTAPDADPSEPQSSVHKILQEMMMSNQLNDTGGMVGVGSFSSDMKNVNGVLPTNGPVLNGGNTLVGNGAVGSNNPGVAGFGTMGGGVGQSAPVNGMRGGMGNNPVMNGRVGVPMMGREQSLSSHQQDLGLLSGLGAVNGFSNLQFDWKPSP